MAKSIKEEAEKGSRRDKIKTKKGAIVTHKDKLWLVDKILIPGRMDQRSKDYIRAFPIYKGQVLYRSIKTIGEDWI